MIRPTIPTLTELLRDFYRPRRLGIAASTVDCYGYAIESLQRFAGRDLHADELNQQLVLSWLADRLENVAPKTVHRERQTILTLWQFAAELGMSESPPKIPAVTVTLGNPVSWDPAEVSRIIAECRKSRGSIRGTELRRADWWSSLILFLYYTGARIGGALSVQSADVDLAKRFCILRGVHAKTGVEQVVRLHPLVCRELFGFLGERDTVWVMPYGRRWLWQSFTRILKRAGLPAGRRRKFHALRRTCYTQCTIHSDRNVAAAQLGHRTDMARYYLDQTKIETQTAADVLPPLNF